MSQNMKSSVFVLSAAILIAITSLQARAQANDPWKHLEFLIGTWSGEGSGKPGEGIAGSTSFSFELDRNILVRKNRAEYAPKPGEKQNIVHEDLLIIYPQAQGGPLRADYFDNEGHVIRYAISFPEGKPAAVFESEAAGGGPRYRLVYELRADTSLFSEFSVAPPGGEFKSYVKGTVKKIR